MSSFSNTPQFTEVIVDFIDNKIKQIEDKLFIQPKEDAEEKVIVEQLLHDDFKGPSKIVNTKLKEDEVIKLREEIDILESFKKFQSEEAFNKLNQQHKSIIDKLNVEHTILTEKSNVQHRLASSNELKLKTLKSEYNKKLKMVYDDDAKGSTDNKASKRLPKMKEELDKLSKDVIIERRDAVHLRENEITSRKNIERIQKEFEIVCEKIKKLEQQFQQQKQEDIIQTQLNEPEHKINVKECWLCEGVCTCDD
jgi:hypothetical protein